LWPVWQLELPILSSGTISWNLMKLKKINITFSGYRSIVTMYHSNSISTSLLKVHLFMFVWELSKCQVWSWVHGVHIILILETDVITTNFSFLHSVDHASCNDSW
jgi:hypothetical protein